MKKTFALGSLVAVILIAFVLSMTPYFVESQEKMPPPFGQEEDVAFAKKLWTAMDGYPEWPIKSKVYPGQTPHGAFIRMFYNMVSVDGKPYHTIIKENFMGKDADGNELNPEIISKSTKKYLGTLTIMVQRETGYDPDNNNWFWVKYNPDGTIAKNPMDILLAGRVAKGMDAGCIACHTGAKDNDYLFVNDGE